MYLTINWSTDKTNPVVENVVKTIINTRIAHDILGFINKYTNNKILRKTDNTPGSQNIPWFLKNEKPIESASEK